MADVVDPVLVNPGSRVMTPIVVSSLEISIPDEPSVAGMTFNSSCLSPYCSDAVAGPSNVGAVGGANVMAPVCSAALVVATAASAVWVTSGIRFLASRSCRDYFDLARRGVARARIDRPLKSRGYWPGEPLRSAGGWLTPAESPQAGALRKPCAEG